MKKEKTPCKTSMLFHVPHAKRANISRVFKLNC